MDTNERAHQRLPAANRRSAAWYRAGQFFRALFARVRAQELEQVLRILTPAQFALFAAMQRSDQRHSLDVCNTLQRAGYDDPILLQASLLHDVGKAAARLSIGHRVAFVLIKRFAPDWLARLARDGKGWKAPFAVYAGHAQRSADWAAQAGSDPRVVACIRSHHLPEPSSKRSAALKWADEQH